jgi:septal ring factor EnvC (AmiA/AmiB activator)
VPKPKPGLPTVEDAQRAVATIKVKFPVARFTFEDAEEYEAGTEMLREVKAQQKDLEEKRKAITKPMDEAKKNILALFKPPEDRLKTAENVLRAAVLDWQRQQEAERRAIEAELREKQRLLQAAAEEEAEKLREEGHDLPLSPSCRRYRRCSWMPRKRMASATARRGRPRSSISRCS